MTVCKRYFLDDCCQYVEIVCAAGRYFIDYNVFTYLGARQATCSAGPFPTFEQAHATLIKHRPHARMI